MLGGWGYLWGALFGPAYLAVKGFVGLALVMIPITILVLAVGGTMIVLMALATPSGEVMTIVGFFLASLTLSVHGYLAVQLLRTGYMRLGYREGYY